MEERSLIDPVRNLSGWTFVQTLGQILDLLEQECNYFDIYIGMSFNCLSKVCLMFGKPALQSKPKKRLMRKKNKIKKPTHSFPITDILFYLSPGEHVLKVLWHWNWGAGKNPIWDSRCIDSILSSSNPTPTHHPLEKVDSFTMCSQVSMLMETQSISFPSEPLFSDVQQKASIWSI